MRKKRKK